MVGCALVTLGPPEEEMAKTHTSAVLGKKIVPSDSKWLIAKPAFRLQGVVTLLDIFRVF